MDSFSKQLLSRYILFIITKWSNVITISVYASDSIKKALYYNRYYIRSCYRFIPKYKIKINNCLKLLFYNMKKKFTHFDKNQLVQHLSYRMTGYLFTYIFYYRSIALKYWGMDVFLLLISEYVEISDYCLDNFARRVLCVGDKPASKMQCV